MKKLLCAALILYCINASANSETATIFNPGMMAEGAPSELRHWSKLVGQWAVDSEKLKRDGSGWESSGKADWDFFWAFNGWGIQDNYTSPPLSEKMEDESMRQQGINLRIYNTDTKQWVLTWLATRSAVPANFTAESTDDQVVMISDDKDANGNYRRITFYDMTEDSFEWKMEWSQDKESWLEVARIHGKSKPE